MDTFKFIDLFAGIGGFHHALKSIGGECVLTCELDDSCEKVYKSLFPESKREGRFVKNIRTVTRTVEDDPKSRRDPSRICELVEQHDVLCAGFPCQPFSKSGHQLGFKDSTRGTLFFDIMEIVNARSPTFLFLENVRNLAGPRHRETWRVIRETIREAGYFTLDEPIVLSPHVLHPDDGGSPQVRERVFILASKRGNADHERRIIQIQDDVQSGKISRDWNPDMWNISERILRGDDSIPDVGRYRLNDEEMAWVEAWDYFVKMIPSDSLPGFPIWANEFKLKPDFPEKCPDWKRNFLEKNSAFYLKYQDLIDNWKLMKWGKGKKTVSDFPRSRQLFEWQAKKAQPRQKDRCLSKLVLQFRPSGIRVKPATYLPALVAITQTSIVGPDVHPGIHQYRELSPGEAALLQGMPSDFFVHAGIDERQAYKQLGNAVNVGVIRYLAKRLIKGESPDYMGQTTLKL